MSIRTNECSQANVNVQQILKSLKMATLQLEDITISRIENPHRFWYNKTDLESEKFHEFQNDLQRIVELHRNGSATANSTTEFVNGDIAAALNSEIQKWMRVRVENVHKNGTVSILALDYGISVDTVDTAQLVKLNSWIAQPKFEKRIFAGLYKVLPTHSSGTWVKRANEQMQSICSNADKTIFIAREKINGQFFGDLLVSFGDDTLQNVSDILIELGMANKLENEPERKYNFFYCGISAGQRQRHFYVPI